MRITLMECCRSLATKHGLTQRVNRTRLDPSVGLQDPTLMYPDMEIVAGQPTVWRLLEQLDKVSSCPSTRLTKRYSSW